MSKKTDGNVYTVVFAVGMVLVVGALLAFLASESALKPFITENKRMKSNRIFCMLWELMKMEKAM